MVSLPESIMIVRHGARLDAADPDWHLQSPTPYDAPLTYGGWKQSQSLGARIADILRSGEYRLHATEHTTPLSQRHSKSMTPCYKIVIHSSPFQRCIQTAIGIAAGIAQKSVPSYDDGSPEPYMSLECANMPMTSSTESREEGNHTDNVDAIIGEHSTKGQFTRRSSAHLRKPVLKIDPFLGEWLSPEYFNQITPPPTSPFMVLSAKASLLVDEEVEPFKSTVMSAGHFPGGWTLPSLQSTTPSENLDTGGTVVKPSIDPQWRFRSSSHGQSRTLSSGSKADHSAMTFYDDEKPFYTSPSVTYPIPVSGPIPRGFVSHARNSCVEVDRTWDSSKRPLGWGDGGSYGEEWSAMQRRLRGGISKLVSWYSSYSEVSPLGSTPRAPNSTTSENSVIVIVVTHNTGCNALIGAMTNQPFLYDVGQASLTMAVRRSGSKAARVGPTNDRKDKAAEVNLSMEYEVKIRASTDHLHDILRPPLNMNLHSGPGTPLSQCSGLQDLAFVPDDISSRDSTSRMNSYHRDLSTSTGPSPSPLSTSSLLDGAIEPSSAQVPAGLWTRGQVNTAKVQYPKENIDLSRLVLSRISTEEAIQMAEAVDDTPESTALGGLWSQKINGPKRRWTTTESPFSA